MLRLYEVEHGELPKNLEQAKLLESDICGRVASAVGPAPDNAFFQLFQKARKEREETEAQLGATVVSEKRRKKLEDIQKSLAPAAKRIPLLRECLKMVVENEAERPESYSGDRYHSQVTSSSVEPIMRRSWSRPALRPRPSAPTARQSVTLTPRDPDLSRSVVPDWLEDHPVYAQIKNRPSGDLLVSVLSKPPAVRLPCESSWLQDWMSEIPFLSRFPLGVRHGLAAYLGVTRARAGDVVYRQGSVGDKLFVIRFGPDDFFGVGYS
eukprot:284121_1